VTQPVYLARSYFLISHSQGRGHSSSTQPSLDPCIHDSISRIWLHVIVRLIIQPRIISLLASTIYRSADCNLTMSLPRRSARLSPHLNQQRHQHQQHQTGPAQAFGQFSQPSSTSTTSYPSPSNDSSNPPPPPPTPAQARLQVHPNFTPTHQQGNTSHLYAPLPSPSVENMGQGAFLNQTYPQEQGQQQQSAPRQQASSPAYQGHQQGHHNSMSQPHPPNIQNTNSGQLPPDFLAEAAKRAQMACLMRDMGDVAL
jgi:hypothetical protein